MRIAASSIYLTPLLRQGLRIGLWFSVSCSALGTAQVLYDIAEIPPATEFESLAPFDVRIETAGGWFLVNGVARELALETPYVEELSGTVVLRIESNNSIRVQSVDLTTTASLPTANAMGHLGIVNIPIQVSLATDFTVVLPPFGDGDACPIDESTGHIRSDGYFTLPWLLRADSEALEAPLFIYLHTWGFVGADAIAPGISYGDFGVVAAIAGLPSEIPGGDIREGFVQTRARLPIGPVPETWPFGPDPTPSPANEQGRDVFWVDLRYAWNTNCFFCNDIADFEGVADAVLEALADRLPPQDDDEVTCLPFPEELVSGGILNTMEALREQP